MVSILRSFSRPILMRIKNRGFAYSFEQIPFSVAQSNEELIKYILEFDEQDYHQKWIGFYQDLLGMYDEGHASEYIAEVIASKC